MAPSPEPSCKLRCGLRYRLRYRVHHPARELLRQFEQRFAARTARLLGTLIVDWPFLRPVTGWQLKRAFREGLRTRSTRPIVETVLDHRKLLRTITARNAYRLTRKLEQRMAAAIAAMLRKEHGGHEFIRPLKIQQLKTLWDGDPRRLLRALIDGEALRAAAKKERRSAIERLEQLELQRLEDSELNIGSTQEEVKLDRRTDKTGRDVDVALASSSTSRPVPSDP